MKIINTVTENRYQYHLQLLQTRTNNTTYIDNKLYFSELTGLVFLILFML